MLPAEDVIRASSTYIFLKESQLGLVQASDSRQTRKGWPSRQQTEARYASLCLLLAVVPGGMCSRTRWFDFGIGCRHRFRPRSQHSTKSIDAAVPHAMTQRCQDLSDGMKGHSPVFASSHFASRCAMGWILALQGPRSHDRPRDPRSGPPPLFRSAEQIHIYSLGRRPNGGAKRRRSRDRLSVPTRAPRPPRPPPSPPPPHAPRSSHPIHFPSHPLAHSIAHCRNRVSWSVFFSVRAAGISSRLLPPSPPFLLAFLRHRRPSERAAPSPVATTDCYCCHCKQPLLD